MCVFPPVVNQSKSLRMKILKWRVPKLTEWNKANSGHRQICIWSSRASLSGQHSCIATTWTSIYTSAPLCEELSPWKNILRSCCSSGSGREPMFQVVIWKTASLSSRYLLRLSEPNSVCDLGCGIWAADNSLSLLFACTIDANEEDVDGHTVGAEGTWGSSLSFSVPSAVFMVSNKWALQLWINYNLY